MAQELTKNPAERLLPDLMREQIEKLCEDMKKFLTESTSPNDFWRRYESIVETTIKQISYTDILQETRLEWKNFMLSSLSEVVFQCLEEIEKPKEIGGENLLQQGIKLIRSLLGLK